LQVLQVLVSRGASFFDDIVERAGILKSQCEAALGELAAAGFVTTDSFTGLRVLLTPTSRRRPLNGSRRRRVAIAGIQDSGRWDLIARETAAEQAPLDADSSVVEVVTRALLRRYGVVFRRAVERESTLPPWRYVLWTLRRLEARGEVRGGRFVAGFSGEQFALPEAVESLRKVKRREPSGELACVCGADPLNLVGTLLPGLRVPATPGNRIVYIDGEAVAIQLGDEIRFLKPVDPTTETRVRTALIKKRPSRSLRAYLRP
jgi:ATP-dependent Lhr-like helicase